MVATYTYTYRYSFYACLFDLSNQACMPILVHYANLVCSKHKSFKGSIHLNMIECYRVRSLHLYQKALHLLLYMYVLLARQNAKAPQKYSNFYETLLFSSYITSYLLR